jgi:hypothetical protein
LRDILNADGHEDLIACSFADMSHEWLLG